MQENWSWASAVPMLVVEQGCSSWTCSYLLGEGCIFQGSDKGYRVGKKVSFFLPSLLSVTLRLPENLIWEPEMPSVLMVLSPERGLGDAPPTCPPGPYPGF